MSVIKGFGTFEEAPGDALQSLDYPITVSEDFFGDFRRFMLSISEGEAALTNNANRRLWSVIISVGDEKR